MIKQILSLLAALWVLKRMDCPPSCSAGPVELTLLEEAICLGNLYIQEIASNSSASEGWMSVNVWDSWIKVQELVRPNAEAGWTVINRSFPCILSQFITALEGFRDNMKGSARFSLHCAGLRHGGRCYAGVKKCCIYWRGARGNSMESGLDGWLSASMFKWPLFQATVAKERYWQMLGHKWHLLQLPTCICRFWNVSM